jgi:hypothetical protein
VDEAVSVGTASVAVMPSHLHEMLVEMFRERPALAAEVLGGLLGAEVPPYQQATLSSGDLADVMPTEYRADLVVTLTVEKSPVWAVVVEVQLRTDARKRRTWPAYVATLHARLGCPIALLVVCPDPRVAAWCSVPIVVGYPHMVLTPLVCGPDQVPVIADAEDARRSPEVAVLSAMAHGGSPDGVEVLEALLAALKVVDHDHASLYADVLLAVLPAAARDYLEAQMVIAGYEYQSDFAKRYFSAGVAQGEARAILGVLDARGIAVPDDVREQIAACTDRDLLDTWVRRAATATDVQELFAP